MNVSEQKVDEILDKINLLGYDALSEEEKTVLKKASEE
jgi:F0F1-type ATP synthase beta subunit